MDALLNHKGSFVLQIDKNIRQMNPAFQIQVYAEIVFII